MRRSRRLMALEGVTCLCMPCDRGFRKPEALWFGAASTAHLVKLLEQRASGISTRRSHGWAGIFGATASERITHGSILISEFCAKSEIVIFAVLMKMSEMKRVNCPLCQGACAANALIQRGKLGGTGRIIAEKQKAKEPRAHKL